MFMQLNVPCLARRARYMSWVLCQGACCKVHLCFRGWLILLLRAQQLILVFNLLAHILCAFALSHALETSGTRIASCPKSIQ